MLPRAEISHHTPGRTRLRVPERRRDKDYLVATERQLALVPGVARASANAATGSILLEHDLSLQDLKTLGRERALFTVVEMDEPKPVLKILAAGVEQFVTGVDKNLRSWSGGGLDAKAVAAAGLLGLSVYQWRRRDFLPAGMMLALMAFDVIKR